MKVGQKSIVRWVSKVVAVGSGRPAHKAGSPSLRELDVEQLRYVSGSSGGSTLSPGKTW